MTVGLASIDLCNINLDTRTIYRPLSGIGVADPEL